MHLLNITTGMPFEIIFAILIGAIIFPFALGTHCLHENRKNEKAHSHVTSDKNQVIRQPSTKRQVTGHTIKVASDKANELNNSTGFFQENFILRCDFFFFLIGSRLLLMRNLLNYTKKRRFPRYIFPGGKYL